MIPHDFVDESAFTPEFLEACSDLGLVKLQHELRQHREDRKYLIVVLEELERREKSRR